MFDQDRPITSSDLDKLDRKEFSESIATAILEMSPESSVVIGLIGGWGSGKTSIVNMIRQYLKIGAAKRVVGEDREDGEYKLLIVDFNPWNSLESSDIVSFFFDELLSRLRSERKAFGLKEGALNAIASSVNEYIAAMKPGVVKIAALTIFKRFRDKKSKGLAERKAGIETWLSDKRIRVLVVVDDLDRLSSDKICQVFQLIAAIADFKYLSYLIAYDEEVVADALKSLQGVSGDRYLEKIVQVPIRIPDMTGAALRNEIARSFASVLDGFCALQGVELSDGMAQRQQILIERIKYHISSLRVLKRVQNAFSFTLGVLGGAIDPVDVLALEALRVLSPQGFCAIESNKSILCIDAKNDLEVTQVNDGALEAIIAGSAARLDAESRKLVVSVAEFVFSSPRREAACGGESRASAYLHKRMFDAEIFERYLTAGISTHLDVSDELLFALSTNDKAKIADLVDGYCKTGRYGEMLECIDGLQHDLDVRQLAVVCEALCENIAMAERLRASYSENTRSIDLLDNAVAAMSEDEACGYVTDLFDRLGELQVFYMAEFVIRRERAYGRHGFKGATREKLFSEDLLQRFEGVFLEKGVRVVEQNELRDLVDSFAPLCLLRALDKDRFADVVVSMGDSLRRDLILAEAFVGAWRSPWEYDHVSSFHLDRSALGYAGYGDVSDLAAPTLSLEDIDTLPVRTQEKLVAFHLFHELRPDADEVSIESVRERLYELAGSSS